MRSGVNTCEPKIFSTGSLSKGSARSQTTLASITC
jgi:hypothetical protein